MIKRNFSFGLKDKLLSSKGANGFGLDPECSPPPSPSPGRRDQLPAQIEYELREACAAIVNNLIPSDYNLADHDDENKLQLEFPVVKMSEPKQSHKEKGRRVSEVPDFPLPSIPLNNRRSVSYKPDTAILDLFPDVDKSEQPAQSDVSVKRRSGYGVFSQDGPVAPRNFARPLSQQFSVTSNLPSLDTVSQLKTVRRAMSQSTDKSTPGTDCTEYPWNASTAATSVAITPAYAKHPSLAQGQVKSEQSRHDGLGLEDRGRDRQIRPTQSLSTVDDFTVAQKLSRSGSRAGSRARSIGQGIKDYVRPGSSGRRSQSISRPATRSKSIDSVRSKASSGVLPAERTRFSWKSWRESWQSRRSTIDLETEQDRKGSKGSRSDKLGSTDETKEEKAVNLNRELPPLPGLDQWKGEEEEPEKPRHIATLLKRRSQDFSKRLSGDFSKFKTSDLAKRFSGDLSKIMSGDLSKKPSMDFHKTREAPICESRRPNYKKQDSIEEVPQLPELDLPSRASEMTIHSGVPVAIPAGSAKLTRKPVPISKTQSPPADSVLGDQERANSKPNVEVRLPSGYNAGSVSSDPPRLESEPVRQASVPTVQDVFVPTKRARRPLSIASITSLTGISMSKRRPSKLDLQHPVHKSPKPYARAYEPESGETSFVARDMRPENYERAAASKYKYADDISAMQNTPPPVPPKDTPLKWLRKTKSKRTMTWMDEMEKLGIKDGLLLTDDLQGSPIVRY